MMKKKQVPVVEVPTVVEVVDSLSLPKINTVIAHEEEEKAKPKDKTPKPAKKGKTEPPPQSDSPERRLEEFMNARKVVPDTPKH